MPVKRYRPDHADAPFPDGGLARGHHQADAGKEPGEGQAGARGGRSSTGRVSSRFRGGGHKKAYREIDFKRDKNGIAAVVAAIEYDPNRSARIALLHYVDGEKRYILAPAGLEVGRKVTVGTGGRHSGRQFAAAQEYSGRHGGSQHRAEAGQGRADGALGRRAGAVGFERRRVRAAEAAFGRNPQGAGGLRGDHRAGRQRRARKRQPGQSRTQALDGQDAAQPRRFDESGGSPARRRRGQNQRRPSSGDALGPADARIQDPQQQAHE